MIPNVTRGDRMSGLMNYLVGAGKTNEHEDPHLVAGDSALMTWHDDNTLDRDAAMRIAAHLDLPRKAFGVEVKGGHVWHCSLSLRAEEGLLTDQLWGEIASEFVSRMGFDDHQGAKAPCRWVAVRHGVSLNGNDHIHIAVNLVREDGTKASIHRDYRHSQDVARELETMFGLQELESVNAERATRGYDPAEREAQARGRAQARHERSIKDGTAALPWELLPGVERNRLVREQLSADQPRYELARTVRGCAAASADEAEFVRRLRRSGVILRPRYADGRDDVVTGYSVAQRPQFGERPIWYGGGQLGRDLTLPRLRSTWPDTPTGAGEAVAEWTAARRQRRAVNPGREMHQPAPELWEQYSRDVAALAERLRRVSPTDRDTWTQVARQTAGAFAAWSNQLEASPGPIAATADSLAVSAQTLRATVRPKPVALASLGGAAMLLASASHGGQGVMAQMVMLRQLRELAKQLYQVHERAQEVRRSQEISALSRNELKQIRERLQLLLPEPALAGVGAGVNIGAESDAGRAVRTAAAGVARIRSMGSPLPNRLEAERKRSISGRRPDSGIER